MMQKYNNLKKKKKAVQATVLKEIEKGQLKQTKKQTNISCPWNPQPQRYTTLNVSAASAQVLLHLWPTPVIESFSGLGLRSRHIPKAGLCQRQNLHLGGLHLCSQMIAQISNSFSINSKPCCPYCRTAPLFINERINGTHLYSISMACLPSVWSVSLLVLKYFIVSCIKFPWKSVEVILANSFKVSSFRGMKVVVYELWSRCNLFNFESIPLPQNSVILIL